MCNDCITNDNVDELRSQYYLFFAVNAEKYENERNSANSYEYFTNL